MHDFYKSKDKSEKILVQVNPFAKAQREGKAAKQTELI